MSTYTIEPNDGRSILNDFVIFKLGGAQTGQNLAIVEHVLAPGELGAPVHTHSREDEYSFVLEGELTVLIDGELVKALPGTLVLKPRGLPHTFWNQGASRLRLLEIISPSNFEHYFDQLAEILASGQGQPDPTALLGLAARYGLELDFGSLETICQKYGVRPLGAVSAPGMIGEPL
jgi:mannose-6-phosphate isomerase-like protein (cupin superfamily)